jgi:ADP-heptose:LPS heptosyltransferase
LPLGFRLVWPIALLLENDSGVVKPSSLGDIVHTPPAVHFLKTTFRDADFYWIANTEWTPLLEVNFRSKSSFPFPRSQFRGASGIVVERSGEYFAVARNTVSLVNQTDLCQLIWLLRQASFIISVDNGPMHIAATIASELLSIHMWSDPRLVGPYNPDAWIWKDHRIVQVRAITQEGQRTRSHARPDPSQIAKFVHGRLLR